MKSFVKGLLFGAVVGGVGGLFFAPRSGKETREKLVSEVDNAAELTENLTESLDHFQASLGKLKETADGVIPSFLDDTAKSLRKFEFQAAPRIKEIKKSVKNIQKKLPDETL